MRLETHVPVMPICAGCRLGDPCKYRLVLKNATAVTVDRELVATAQAQMQGILRQLQRIDDKLDMASSGGDAAAASEVPQLLQEAIASNERFEKSITACLGL